MSSRPLHWVDVGRLSFSLLSDRDELRLDALPCNNKNEATIANILPIMMDDVCVLVLTYAKFLQIVRLLISLHMNWTYNNNIPITSITVNPSRSQLESSAITRE
jgi:hypothetical protein